MRSLLLGLALVAGCGGGVVRVGPRNATVDAEEHEREVTSEPEPDAYPILMWTVEVDGQRSHLLATLPSGVTLEQVLHPPYRHLFDDSRVLLTALDPNALSPASLQESGLLERRRRLDRALGRETYALLRRRVGDRLPATLLRRLHPGVVVDHLEQISIAEVIAAREGRPPVTGARSSSVMVDELVTAARTAGRPVVVLETAAQRLEDFRAVSERALVDEIRWQLETPAAVRRATRQLIDAYLGARLSDTMARFGAHPAGPAVDTAQRQQRVRRLERWMPRILEEIRTGNAFLALELSAVVGPAGVLDRLRHGGVTLERVGPEPAEG